jgi:hypothetical protein
VARRWLTVAPLLAVFAFGQGSSPQHIPPPKLTVSTDKAVYHLGEPIHIKFELKNESSEPIYIPKEWGRSGEGVPGFYEYIEQLQGAKGTMTCDPTAVSRRIYTKRKKPEELLSAYYLLLGENQSISSQIEAAGCETQTAGKYRVRAEYSPSVRFVPAANFRNLEHPLLRQKLAATSAEFEVVENRTE